MNLKMASSGRQLFQSMLWTVLALGPILSAQAIYPLRKVIAAETRRGQKEGTPKSVALAPLPRLLDRQGLAAVLARHRGQAVLVNFWATWCEPCRQEFAWLNNLSERYRHRGLVVLAVSVDLPSAFTQVRKFLIQQKPRFPTYLKKPGDDEEFINAIDAGWSGALPATFVYDVTGKRVRSMFGEQTPDSFDAAVRNFLPRPDGADQPPLPKLRENRGPRPAPGG